MKKDKRILDANVLTKPKSQVEEEWLRHALESEEVEQKSQKPLDTAGSSPEHPHHAIHVIICTLFSMTELV